MGDTNNLELATSGITDVETRKVVRDIFEQFSGGFDHYDDVDVDPFDLQLGANDISQGACYELPSALDSFMEKGETVECLACRGTGIRKAEALSQDDGTCARCAGDGEFLLKPEPFAYWTNDDPANEWLGTATIFVPGVGVWQGECAEGGDPVIDTNRVMALVNAATDLEQLKQDIRKDSGGLYLEAFRAYKKEDAPS